MQIFVRSLEQTFTVELSENATLYDLKEAIEVRGVFCASVVAAAVVSDVAAVVAVFA